MKIENVNVNGGRNGDRLHVEIPTGMTGAQLLAWKQRNQTAITKTTTEAIEPSVEGVNEQTGEEVAPADDESG